MARFTQQEADAVKRLLPYAKQKQFVADLILNAHNTDAVDMRRVMRYAEGEVSSSTYLKDVFVLLDLMRRGVESYEVVGNEVILQLLDKNLPVPAKEKIW